MTDEEHVIFESIDLASGNVVNDFAHLHDALEFMRRLAAAHGWETAENLALMRLAGDDQSLVAMSASLKDLAASVEHATTAAR